MKRTLIDQRSGSIVAVVFPGFETAVEPPLIWVDCPDETRSDTHSWDGQAVTPTQPPVLSGNAALDVQIESVYARAPWTPRAMFELAFSICLIRDAQDCQTENFARAIRALALGEANPTYVPVLAFDFAKQVWIEGPVTSLAKFDVPRVKDLKTNSGMVAVKQVLDATSTLRRQKT